MDTLFVINDSIVVKFNAAVLEKLACAKETCTTVQEAETNCLDVLIILIICATIGLTIYGCVRAILKFTSSVNEAKEKAQKQQHDFEKALKQFETVELEKMKKETDYAFFKNKMEMEEKKLGLDKMQTEANIKKKIMDNYCEVYKKKLEENYDSAYMNSFIEKMIGHWKILCQEMSENKAKDKIEEVVTTEEKKNSDKKTTDQ